MSNRTTRIYRALPEYSLSTSRLSGDILGVSLSWSRCNRPYQENGPNLVWEFLNINGIVRATLYAGMAPNEKAIVYAHNKIPPKFRYAIPVAVKDLPDELIVALGDVPSDVAGFWLTIEDGFLVMTPVGYFWR